MTPAALGKGRWASSRTILSILVVAYVVGAGLAWAALTPIGGAGDEPTHIAQAAAVVRGDLGTPGHSDHPVWKQQAIIMVPEWLTSIGIPCYASHPEVTADCAPALGSSETLVAFASSATRYPPLYYSLVGLPTLVMSGAGAVYAMRAISVLLAAGLIASGLIVASPGRRPWLALAVMISFTPTAGHLAASVNPNGFDSAAALGLGIALVGTVGSERSTRFTIVTSGLVFALAWARPMSFLALGGVILVGVLVNGANLRRRLPQRAWRSALVALVLLATLSAVGFELLVRQPATRVVAAAAVGGAHVPLEFAENLRWLSEQFLNWAHDLVGNFGWGDHRPPVFVRWGWLALGTALVAVALAAGTRLQRLAISATIVGATVVAPLSVLQFVMRADDYQGRYHLPLVMLIAVVAAVVVADSRSERHRRAGWTLLRWGSLFTGAVMLISMAGSMHRYAIGGEMPSLSDLLTPRFLSNLNWIPATAMGMVVVGTLVLVVTAGSIFAATRTLGRGARQGEAGSDTG